MALFLIYQNSWRTYLCKATRSLSRKIVRVADAEEEQKQKDMEIIIRQYSMYIGTLSALEINKFFEQ